MSWLRITAFVAVAVVAVVFGTPAREGKMGTNFGENLAKNKNLDNTVAKMKLRLAGYKAAAGSKPEPPALLPNKPQSSRLAVGDNGCPDGWKGSDCKNPICWNETSPFWTHDGLNIGLGDMIETDIGEKCKERFTFPVDFDMPLDVYVIVTADAAGSTPYSQLFDRKMNEIIPCADVILSATTTVQKYCGVLNNYGAGLYTVVLHSSFESPCLFEVHAPTFLFPDGGFVASPQDDVVQMFQPDENQAISQNPTEGIPSYLAFRMTHDVFPVQPQTVQFYSNGLWAQSSHLIARFQCATPHISVGTFTCAQGNVYYLKIQGIDDNGYPWQRVYGFECDARPTTTPGTTPPLPVYPTCEQSVPKIDLIIAFDTSSTMAKTDFSNSIDDFYDLIDYVQFGRAYTRAILGTYDQQLYFDDQHFAETLSNSKYITRLVQLMYNGYTGEKGNNLLSLMNYVNGLQTGADAFRFTSRKMIVYFSSTNWSQDPMNVAQNLRAQGVEFFPIAFGPGANFTQAQLISPKCARWVKSEWDLRDTINYFFSTLCSSTPIC